VRELKADQNLLIWGSPTLVQGLLDAGLSTSSCCSTRRSCAAGSGCSARTSSTGCGRDATVLSGGMLGLRLTA
jgi:hypothetical protein